MKLICSVVCFVAFVKRPALWMPFAWGPQWQTPALAGESSVYDIKQLAYRKELGESGVVSLVDDKERIKAGL